MNKNKQNDKKISIIIPIKSSDFYLMDVLIPRLKKYISNSNIIIISSIEIENECQKYGVKFLEENKLINGLSYNSVKHKLEKLNVDAKATGWYLQQFIKFAFCTKCETEYYLSWDADMLPLRPINFFDKNGKPYLTLKKEYKKKYFITLKRLLNLDKIRKESYIAEHMLFSKTLVKKLIDEINHTNFTGNFFWEKILSATLPNSRNDVYAFSEFETYGTWIDTYYPEFYTKRKLNMFRHGNFFFGEDQKEKYLNWCAKIFDTVSFEHFDYQIISKKLMMFIKNVIPAQIFFKIIPFLLPNEYKFALQEFDWFFGKKIVCTDLFLAKQDVLADCKIHLLFDASFLNFFDSKSNSRSGIYWTAYNLLKELSKRDDIDISLYSHDMKKTEQFLCFYKTDFPKIQLYTNNKVFFDIYFHTFGIIPSEIRRSGIKCALILYDCTPLKIPSYKNAKHSWFFDMLDDLNVKDFYFAISKNTKYDFLNYCKQINDQQITITPLAVSNNFYQEKNQDKINQVRQKYNIPIGKKYIFSLCSLAPHKNLIRAVKTFVQFIQKNKIDDLVFILGGGTYDIFIKDLEECFSSLGEYKNKIIQAGYVADEDLASLYSGAEWFVYTSQYEGFGLPPLEAMSCGCPVITSNNSSLPEVIGDAGVMIDYDNDEQHITAYENYYFNEDLRRSYASKGLERAKQFSWKKTADIIIYKLKEYNYLQPSVQFSISENISKNNAISANDKLTKKIRLLGCLTIFKYKQKYKNKKWYLFCFPVFRIKQKNEFKKKIYLLGIPILKIVESKK